MPYFRKKPVTIEAVQLSWKTWNELCDFLDGVVGHNPGREAPGTRDQECPVTGERGPLIELTIPTLEGDMVARHGDWIIKGVKGEVYPCKPDIFAETYEPVPPGGDGG